jgi:hypothetical protein
MLLKDVIEHFGTRMNAADAIGVTKQAVSHFGYRVSKNMARDFDEVTYGSLKYDKSVYIKPEVVEVSGIEYVEAVDINYPTTLRRKLDSLYFYQSGAMRPATWFEDSELMEMYRNYPVFRKV